MRKPFLICVICVINLCNLPSLMFRQAGLCYGQDIHFSQFYFSPLNLNPAQTGFFNGTQRLALNYRNQWKLAAGGFPYVTYSASFDMHILDNAMTSADIMGVGIIAFSDKAGTGHLAKQGVLASLAYNRDLTGHGVHIVGVGIQGGIVQMESSLSISNVMLICPRCSKPTRVGFIFLADGTKQRACKKCKEILEK